MRTIRVLISLVAALTCVWTSRADQHARADALASQAENHIGASDFETAAKLYRQAIAAEKRSTSPRHTDIALYHAMAAYAYQQWGRFMDALAELDTARALFATHGVPGDIATADMNLGIAYKSIGRFDSASACYQRALRHYREVQDSSNLSRIYANLAVLYRNWGRYDKALEYNHNGMTIDERRGDRSARMNKLNNLAGVYYSMGDLDKAIGNQREALEEAKAIDDAYRSAIILNNLASLLVDKKEYEKALAHYREAQEGYRKTQDREGLAINMSCIGNLYTEQKKLPLAFGWHERALSLNRRMNRRHGVASSLADIGIVHWHDGAYGAATDSLRKAVAILDSLRLTAAGDVRRDYLSSQIESYQWLVSSLLRQGRAAEAFDAAEQASAKYLAEQIGRAGPQARWEGIDRWRRVLPKNTTVVCFANVNAESPLVRFIVTPDTVAAIELGIDSALGALAPRCPSDKRRGHDGTRGIRVAPRTGVRRDKPSLNQLVACFRSLLADPRSDVSAIRSLATGIGGMLFDGLVGIAPETEELIVIPDGILGFVPFEALVLDDGRYVVERYAVRYAHSLRVLDLVMQRAHGGKRKPLLAYGGARYRTSETGGVIETPQQQAAVATLTRGLAHSGGGMQQAYASAGLADWPELPGTLTEVETIGRILRRSKVLTGDDVSEAAVKEASRTGALREYRVVHFATHGVVVPDLAELSALVLSTPSRPDSSDDGYLRMNEIASLNLEADLVTLSACETGLGQIYGGERVVGLTQAFLIAGANGLAASLWQVADLSTMKFMIGMYSLMDDDDLSCAEALAQMKRRFITSGDDVDAMLVKRGIAVKPSKGAASSGAYSHPFFWAPFVYYGR
ncbi:MAG: CHAT domain-containing protein [Chitinivibrionales bacterium]|nr:CHAT domain-containing protein [Chitinivibrionales bacterium]